MNRNTAGVRGLKELASREQRRSWVQKLEAKLGGQAENTSRLPIDPEDGLVLRDSDWVAKLYIAHDDERKETLVQLVPMEGDKEGPFELSGGVSEDGVLRYVSKGGFGEYQGEQQGGSYDFRDDTGQKFQRDPEYNAIASEFDIELSRAAAATNRSR